MEKDFLILKNNTRSKRIYFNQLLYFQVEDYVLTCVMADNEKFSCVKSLKDLWPELPANLIQVRRNYIVNVKMIEFLNSTKRFVVMNNGHIIKIPRRKMKQISDAYGI